MIKSIAKYPFYSSIVFGHFSYVAILIGALLINSCQYHDSKGEVQAAFYHWKTHLKLTKEERAAIDSLGVQKLYVKFFDIDWDASLKSPIPLAEVQIDTTYLYGLEIVPTVFITNRTFLNVEFKEVENLAKKVLKKLVIGSQQLTVNEFQMDCDWTLRTREKYFHFLKALSSETLDFELIFTNKKISTTIRLHQVKYPEQTGVPPVDRGMLMAYNVGEVDEWETENSILDLATLKSYLSTESDYLLPLDVALPIFQWGIVFRGNLVDESDFELSYLINDLGPKDLDDTSRFSKLGPNRFEVRKNTYLEGYYLYEKDKIRLESISPELLEASGDELSEFLNRKKDKGPATLSFYHLDTSTLKVFDHEKLEKVLEKF